jgi:hypothetical protein
MKDIIESKRYLDIPVLPNEGAGKYFDGAVFDHRDARAENSNRVIKIKTPKNLRSSAVVIGALSTSRSLSEVMVTIVESWSGGNIKRK